MATSRSPAREPLHEELALQALLRAYPRALVDGAIDAVDAAEQRERLLPAHVTFYFVLGLALFPHLGYHDVVRRVLSASGAEFSVVPSSPALSKARRRLGVAPFAELFARVTPLPDAEVVTATGVTPAADVGLHALRDVATGAVLAAGISTPRRPAPDVWASLFADLSQRALVIGDGFPLAQPSMPRLVRAAGHDLLWRPGPRFRFTPESVLSDGSVVCCADYAAPCAPGTQFRVFDRTGRDPMAADAPARDRLMTTWLDHRSAPASMLAGLHAASMPVTRSMAERDRAYVPRSKDIAGVEQELWALLLAQRAAKLPPYSKGDN